MEPKTLFLRAIDPVHIGTGGYSLGRVDNSIVREPATNIPKIPGTALSGASRHYAAEIYAKSPNIESVGGRRPDPNQICAGLGLQPPHCGNCPVCYTFGYSRADANNYAGTVNVFDAQVLLFPTRSIYGVVWITTENLLEEAEIDVQSNPGTPFTINQEWHNKPMNLGWRLIEQLRHGTLSNVPSGIDSIVNDRIVILDEGNFSLIVNANLEVRTSVAINPKTGTAQEHALFTYEAIPRNTVFVMEVVEDNYRRDQNSYLPVKKDGQDYWKSPLDVLLAGLDMIKQRGIGGMGTRGFGRIAVIGSQ